VLTYNLDVRSVNGKINKFLFGIYSSVNMLKNRQLLYV